MDEAIVNYFFSDSIIMVYVVVVKALFWAIVKCNLPTKRIESDASASSSSSSDATPHIVVALISNTPHHHQCNAAPSSPKS